MTNKVIKLIIKESKIILKLLISSDLSDIMAGILAITENMEDILPNSSNEIKLSMKYLESFISIDEIHSDYNKELAEAKLIGLDKRYTNILSLSYRSDASYFINCVSTLKDEVETLESTYLHPGYGIALDDVLEKCDAYFYRRVEILRSEGGDPSEIISAAMNKALKVLKESSLLNE